MNQLKYIRQENNEFTVWSDMTDVWHKHMAQLAEIRTRSKIPVISAGFFVIEYHEGEAPEVRCFGRSESLNLDSKPEDSALLASFLGLSS